MISVHIDVSSWPEVYSGVVAGGLQNVRALQGAARQSQKRQISFRSAPLDNVIDKISRLL